MRSRRYGSAIRRIAIVAGALALGGCVSGAYLYDDDPGAYYRGSYGHPQYVHSGYPAYYGYHRYYAYAPYPPRVPYYDHDHRGDDHHQSHRDGGPPVDPDRHDRGDQDRPPRDQDGRTDRRPPGTAPVAPPAERQAPPRRVSAEGPGSPPQSRGMRALRAQQSAERDRKFEARKDQD